jgi:hypothetical protein
LAALLSQSPERIPLQVLSSFLCWRAWAKNTKAQRLLDAEAKKLRGESQAPGTTLCWNRYQICLSLVCLIMQAL